MFRKLRCPAAGTTEPMRSGIVAGNLGEMGASSAEYALILALVVISLITTLSALGAALNDKLREIVEQIANAG
jgi:pilus assembly protein Flp/PilA